MDTNIIDLYAKPKAWRFSQGKNLNSLAEVETLGNAAAQRSDN